jgi:MFS transporter, putative metabolite:H+ symporter
MSQFIATANDAIGTMSAADAANASVQRDIAARLERLPITRTHVRARVIVGLATFFDGFDALSIAFVMPVLAVAWRLTPSETGMLISGAYVGQVMGALFFPWASDRFGRLWSTAYSAGLFGAASFLCALCWNMPSLLVARFIQGCGLGGEVPVAATYINELARAPTRGRFFLLYETAFAVGYVGAASVGLWLVPNYGWQSIFIIGACPALVAAVMRRLLPESPRWLASKGRIAEADTVVRRMEREAEAKLGQPLPAPELGRVPPFDARKTRLRELFQGVYLRRTGVVWTLWFCQFFTTQALNSWLPTIYRTQLHLSVQQSLQYSFVNYGLGILSAITVAMLLDHSGRRLWFACALPLGALPLLILAYTGVGSTMWVVILATSSVFCHSTCSVSLYVYTPELYPTRMRGFACGTAATMRNIGASLSPTLVGLVLGTYGISSVFLMLGLVPLIAATTVALFGIETKGRVLEEISP